MSQTNCSVRSNNFKIKPEKKEAFKKFIQACDGKIDEGEKVVTFMLNDSIPDEIYNVESVDSLKKLGIDIEIGEEFDFFGILASFLKGNSVAIVFESVVESSFEWTKYAGGSATAVNSKGETKNVYTEQIYDIAKDLGKIEKL